MKKLIFTFLITITLVNFTNAAQETLETKTQTNRYQTKKICKGALGLGASCMFGYLIYKNIQANKLMDQSNDQQSDFFNFISFIPNIVYTNCATPLALLTWAALSYKALKFGIVSLKNEKTVQAGSTKSSII